MSQPTSDHLSRRQCARTLPPVDKAEILDAVEKWKPLLGIPPAPAAGVRDLTGRTVRVPKFMDNDAVRFFFPRRTLAFHRAMVTQLRVQVQRRGAKIESVYISIEDYARWQDASGEPDSEGLRYRYATELP